MFGQVRELDRLHEGGLHLRERRRRRPAGSLLFVHGLGESGLCFEGLLRRPELASWDILCPDLPGYGRSLWPDPAPLGGVADLLAELARRRLRARPLVLVGHSLGGVLGILAAERHPGLLDALVDVDGNISAGDCAYSGPAARQELAEFLAGGFEELKERVYRRGLVDAAHRGYHASLSLADPVAFHRHSRELVRLSEAEDLATRLSRLELPVLYIAGYPGGACARSRDLLERTPVPWMAVEDSGHWPFIDRPAAFAAALAGFLAEIAPPGAEPPGSSAPAA